MKNLVIALFILSMNITTNRIYAQSENAISFDNFDDYITAPSASSLIAGSTEISMTFWVLAANTAPTYPDYDGFAGFRNNNDADFYILQLTANGLEARFRNSSGVNYDITFGGFQTGTPQHLALTYDGTTLSLYHNGVLASSGAASGTITNSFESFYLGMLPWTGANFYTNGRLDEVSLWNKSLSPSEVNCIYEGAINPGENGLLLYYKCNQGIAGGNNTSVSGLIDSKGNINGILNNFNLNGTSSNFVNGVITGNSATITDSICAGGSYIFGSQTLTVPGVYFESFPGTSGCDSVVMLNLISANPNINTSVQQNGIILTAQQSGASYQWIDCTNGNTPIPGDTNQTYTASVNGQYAVIVSVNGCADTSACFNVTGVGLPENSGSGIMIHPSASFNDVITIINSTSLKPVDIVVSDHSGKTVSKIKIAGGSTAVLNTTSWLPGIYMLSQTEGSFRQRLLKLK